MNVIRITCVTKKLLAHMECTRLRNEAVKRALDLLAQDRVLAALEAADEADTWTLKLAHLEGTL